MANLTQLERYKILRDYIDVRFKENIDIKKVEEICFYSYRNINRIFLALHGETIGKYLKRIRLEKGAEYLKYSEYPVAEIAYEVGFGDLAAFSKAFKARFGHSPQAFRKEVELQLEKYRNSLPDRVQQVKLEYVLETLPTFDLLYLQYQGDINDGEAVEKAWESHMIYADSKNLLDDNSIYFAEILDDNEITDEVHFRYNIALMLDRPLNFEPAGLFRAKSHEKQNYLKFIHKGSDELAAETYNSIYANWTDQIKFEPADLPILEFYLNREEDIPPAEFITEIYIPVY